MLNHFLTIYNYKYKLLSTALIIVLNSSRLVLAVNDSLVISNQKVEGSFSIFDSGKSSPLVADENDYPGVIRALKDLKDDMKKVTNVEPGIFLNKVPKKGAVILVGTVGKSKIIDELVKNKKLDVQDIEGKWESFIIHVIDHPLNGIEKALVIAGSDKRGTIYGIYEVSKQIGVSPWYWWADVPIEHKDFLFVKPGKYLQGPPSVKYRGIFLNDEYPDLTNWVKMKFDTVPPSKDPSVHVPSGVANYNHQFYARIFEVLLRLRANYLWPAMWNNAFNEDDLANPKLADEYGIVMGTSHQEPMMRAQKEWDRRYMRKLGTWNYAKYPGIMDTFWREGIKRNKKYENLVTMGLRGANDTPMAPGGPETNISLLEKIVDVQRKIIAEECNPDVTKVPQMWCLYKEVQDYYNAGMRVPDDITMLWAEDNWGNIRRLPTADERKRSGGAGIYYHFDYHGGPRSYQWLNTSPIPKIWDQMSLAKQYGADRIWIVNVGHFKGYEFPLEFFMNMGWNTEKWNNNNLDEFTYSWAKREFGVTYAKDIADIISKYTKYTGRRKPELLSPSTYSIVNYGEAEKVVADYGRIADKADEISSKLPKEKRDAFYELVLFPTKACAVLNDLYFAAGRNALYAKQGRANTNDMAELTRALFKMDTSMTVYFNHVFANGKWNHFMDQSHIGYTSWADPPRNSLRAVKLTEIQLPNTADIGVAIEGSEEAWPESKNAAILPKFDNFNDQHRFIDVFNKSQVSFEFTATTDEPWILLSDNKGYLVKEKRLWVHIDWSKFPKGASTGIIKIKGAQKEVTVKVTALIPAQPTPENLEGFVEGDGCVSIEAAHYTKNIDAGINQWVIIKDYGHTLSGMRASAATDAPAATPGKDAPCLEYRMYLFTEGDVDVKTIFSPGLNFIPGRPVRYAISFDNEAPKTVTLLSEKYNAANGNRDWEKVVEDNMRGSYSKHTIHKAGYHTLKIWMIDPGVVLQKIIVNLGGVRPSYLGPPESFYRMVKE
jgi:hypothetical protein